MTYHVLLFCAFVLAIGPMLERAFFQAFKNTFGQQSEERMLSLASMAMVAFGVVSLYGITGGNLARAIEPGPVTGRWSETSAILGSIMFLSARYLSFNKSISYAQGFYSSCLLLIALLLAAVFVAEDPDSEVQRLLSGATPIAYMKYAAISMAVSVAMCEGVLLIVPGRYCIALAREHLEDTEYYVRLSGAKRIRHDINQELVVFAREVPPPWSSLPVRRDDEIQWLCAKPDAILIASVVDCLERIHRRWLDDGFDGRSPRALVLVHDDVDIPQTLRSHAMVEVRRFRGVGATRMLLMGSKLAYLGVGTAGQGLHTLSPYALKIDDATRIASLASTFDMCWLLAEHRPLAVPGPPEGQAPGLEAL